jgi:hypothetical protein
VFVASPQKLKNCSLDVKHQSISFSAKHTALRRKSKDWLARNQDNVFEWGDVYPWTVISVTVSQHYKNSTKHVEQINFFSP